MTTSAEVTRRTQSSGRRRDPVGQRRHRDRLDVLGRHVVAALEHRLAAGQGDQRQPAAGAGAEGDLRVRAGGVHERRRRSAGTEASTCTSSSDSRIATTVSASTTGDSVGGAHPCRSRRCSSSCSSSIAEVAEGDPEQEPVELCLGKRVGALVLDRVVGREHDERLRERPGLAVAGDLLLGPASRRWPRSRSPATARPGRCRSRSSCSRPTTRSSTRAPTRFPRPSSTGSCCGSPSATSAWTTSRSCCSAGSGTAGRRRSCRRSSTPTPCSRCASRSSWCRSSRRSCATSSSLVHASRAHPQVTVGASPRGGLALVALARGQAVLERRDYVTPEDVKAVAVPALAHRISPAPRALGTPGHLRRRRRRTCSTRSRCRADDGPRPDPPRLRPDAAAAPAGDGGRARRGAGRGDRARRAARRSRWSRWSCSC